MPPATPLARPNGPADSPTQARSPQRSLAWLIAATTLARLLFSACLGLGIDESYMVAGSRQFHFGYFDHPPIAWWLVWAVTHATGLESPTIVRLPFILLFALSTWLIFRLTARLYSPAAGFWAAAMLNAVPVLSITAGTWVLPDGPLIAASLGGALCLVHALPGGRFAWRWWLGAGACLGVALCSKYTAILIAAGAGLYLLTEPHARRWLKAPHPYAAALLALVMFLPVLAWNASNHWASFLFQGARSGGTKWLPFGPLATLAGEALFFIPWLWLALAWCLWRALRTGPAYPRGWLCVCLALPTIAGFELVSLHAHVLFHWAAPGTMMAIPLLGEAISRHWHTSRALRRVVQATTLAILLGTTVIATEVRFNWLPAFRENFERGADPDLALVDWVSLRTELASRGLLHQGTLLAAVRWTDAGKIDYALHGEATVLCIGNDPREYGLLAPLAAYAGRDLLIVAPRETLASLPGRFSVTFNRIDPLPPIMLRHAGKPAMMLPLFLGVGLHPVATIDK